MVARYSHLAKSHKAEALERLAQFPTLFPTPRPAGSAELPTAVQVR